MTIVEYMKGVFSDGYWLRAVVGIAVLLLFGALIGCVSFVPDQAEEAEENTNDIGTQTTEPPSETEEINGAGETDGSEPQPEPECNGDYAPTNAEQEFVVDAEVGHESEVSEALSAGIDPDARNERGDTALTMAAANGRARIVNMLLNAGADPDGTKCQLVSPAWVKRYVKGAPLQYAAVDNDVEILKMLVEAGAFVTAKDNQRNTALMWAALYANHAAVEFLLENGAQPGYENPDGENAIDWARSDVTLGAPKTSEDVRKTVQLIRSYMDGQNGEGQD